MRAPRPRTKQRVETPAVATIRLDGRWIGTVTYDWGLASSETFILQATGENVTGSASFLGHGYALLRGSLEGSSVRFDTRRIVTAGASVPWEAVNHYAGTIDGDEIHMMLSIEDAAAPHEPITFKLSRVPM